MAGRKQIPDGIKVIKGTLRNHRVNKQQPRPGKGILTAPDFLKPIAAEEYERKAELLDRLGVFGEGDDVALAAYAEAYARWIEAQEILKVQPPVFVTYEREPETDKNGNVILDANGKPKRRVKAIHRNPAVMVLGDAVDTMYRFLTEFGLTPISRQRIKVDSSTSVSEWEVFSRNG